MQNFLISATGRANKQTFAKMDIPSFSLTGFNCFLKKCYPFLSRGLIQVKRVRKKDSPALSTECPKRDVWSCIV